MLSCFVLGETKRARREALPSSRSLSTRELEAIRRRAREMRLAAEAAREIALEQAAQARRARAPLPARAPAHFPPSSERLARIPAKRTEPHTPAVRRLDSVSPAGAPISRPLRLIRGRLDERALCPEGDAQKATRSPSSEARDRAPGLPVFARASETYREIEDSRSKRTGSRPARPTVVLPPIEPIERAIRTLAGKLQLGNDAWSKVAKTSERSGERCSRLSREKILATALSLLERSPFEPLALGAVADELGVRSTSLRPFVGSREDLVEELRDEVLSRFRCELDANDSWERQLEQLLRAAREHVRRHPFLAVEDQGEPVAWPALVVPLVATLRRAGIAGTRLGEAIRWLGRTFGRLAMLEHAAQRGGARDVSERELVAALEAALQKMRDLAER